MLAVAADERAVAALAKKRRSKVPQEEADELEEEEGEEEQEQGEEQEEECEVEEGGGIEEQESHCDESQRAEEKRPKKTNESQGIKCCFPVASPKFPPVTLAICRGYVRNFAWQQFPRNCCHTIL